MRFSTTPCDPNEVVANAATRRQLRQRLEALTADVSTRRARVVRALYQFDSAVPTEADAFLTPTPAHDHHRLIDAWLLLCRVVRAERFAGGLDLIRADTAGQPDDLRLAMCFFQLTAEAQRPELLALLGQVDRLEPEADAFDPRAACRRGFWNCVRRLLGIIVPRPWDSGAVPAWLPEWSEVSRLHQQLTGPAGAAPADPVRGAASSAAQPPVPGAAAAPAEKASPPAVAMTPPSEQALQAWRLKALVGLSSQRAIAEAMTQQLGRQVSQGQVSRWLREAGLFLAFGNQLPPLPAAGAAKPISVDPQRLDLGPRLDRCVPRQRKPENRDA